jgi:Protein of unknown function (DUF3306)
MTEEREGRLARWSRLKRMHGERQGNRPSVASQQPAVGTGPAPPQQKLPQVTEETARPATTSPELPPIAELNKDSDFTPFLRAGVPESAHREALRALWRSDPAFAFRDGLTDYDEDYTAIGMVEQVVRTVYQAGQGYLEETEASPTAEPVEGAGEAVAATSPLAAESEGQSVAAVRTDQAERAADTAKAGTAES